MRTTAFEGRGHRGLLALCALAPGVVGTEARDRLLTEATRGAQQKMIEHREGKRGSLSVTKFYAISDFVAQP
jgi:hypothetical protein